MSASALGLPSPWPSAPVVQAACEPYALHQLLVLYSQGLSVHCPLQTTAGPPTSQDLPLRRVKLRGTFPQGSKGDMVV